MAPPSSPEYAGDISAAEAWAAARRPIPGAQLVDVRTMAEWNFVGLPDLSAAGPPGALHRMAGVSRRWRAIPASSREAEPGRGQRDKDTPVLLLCRSGARSRAAAIALTQAGFRQAFNIAGGFEGDPDGERPSRHTQWMEGGGLPWRQS